MLALKARHTDGTVGYFRSTSEIPDGYVMLRVVDLPNLKATQADECFIVHNKGEKDGKDNKDKGVYATRADVRQRMACQNANTKTAYE